MTCYFQQCGILPSVYLDEPVQPPVKLKNIKWCSVSGLTIKNTQATILGSDQTARMLCLATHLTCICELRMIYYDYAHMHACTSILL